MGGSFSHPKHSTGRQELKGESCCCPSRGSEQPWGEMLSSGVAVRAAVMAGGRARRGEAVGALLLLDWGAEVRAECLTLLQTSDSPGCALCSLLASNLT